MRRAIVVAALLAACKSAPVPSSFGINITVDESSVPSSARSQIVSAALSVSGDETYSRTFDIRSAAASGQVRFRYIPGIMNGTIALALEALAADGSVIARAPATTVTISAGRAVSATLVLGGASSDDMGSSGDGGADGGTCDPGFHDCSSTCVDDRSVATCGQSCTACPVGANATAATCDGTSCGLQCTAGYHVCGGACLSSTSSDSCNMSCTPCTPPTGGTATCDGTSCGGSCPNGQKLCFGACIATSMACNGSCPSGTHECNGNCFDNTSVNSCGTSCTPCPVPTNATMATCGGNGQCGFVCNAGYKQCGSACIPMTGCCMTSDCTQPANGVATCDTSTNTCVIACNNNFNKCGSECIALTACCHDSDCTPPTNGTVSCNASHACIESCAAPYTAACNHVCTDTTMDVNNCGACGNTCGGQCALSRCTVTLASGQNSPAYIAIDTSAVYWSTGSSCPSTVGAVMKVPLSGGTATAVAPSQVVTALTIDNTSAYWVGTDCNNLGMLQIRSARKVGGGSVTNLAVLPTVFAVNGFATDNVNVYAAQRGEGTTPGAVMSVPKGGGALTTLATGDGNLGTIALDATYIYWIEGGINKTPLGGGSSSQVSSAQGGDTLAMANGSLYWASGGASGTVSRVSTAGGTVTDLATGLSYPQKAVTDGSYVYFVAFNAALSASNIMKVSVSGSSAQMVVVGATPSSLAVDGTSVYWTTSSAVMKATPK